MAGGCARTVRRSRRGLHLRTVALVAVSRLVPCTPLHPCLGPHRAQLQRTAETEAGLRAQLERATAALTQERLRSGQLEAQLQVRGRGILGVLHRALGVLHRVLGVLHRVLGVLHRVLGILHRVPGVLHRVLGILLRVPGVLHRVLGVLRRALGLWFVVRGAWLDAEACPHPLAWPRGG